MRGGMIAFVLVAAALAAGCVTPNQDTLTAASAPSTAGSGSHVLRILVTDEPRGPPLAGASVVVTTETWGAWWGLGQPTEDTLTLATDAQGVAEAHVSPDGRTKLVASLPGHTQETLLDVDASASEVVVPLYKDHLSVWMNGTLSPADASGYRLGMTRFAWDPQPIAFGSAADVREGYARRVVLLNATLSWENTLAGGGDLGIGLGRTSGAPDVVQESSQPPALPGRYEETLSVGPADAHRARWESASALFAGAGTGSAYIAPAGLPYTMRIDAVFDGNRALHDSPGFNQVWGALAALAGVALLVPRRAR